MLVVEDLTDVIKKRHPYTVWRTRRREVEAVAVHRFGQDIEGRRIDTLLDIADAFAHVKELRSAFGLGAVYEFVVTADGRAQQWLPLSTYGAHAGHWNSRTVGIACLGDFREHAMPEAQWRSLVELVTVLRSAYDDCDAKGHDELPGSSKDPDKVCPGDLLDMAKLRHVTEPRLCHDPAQFGIRVAA